MPFSLDSFYETNRRILIWLILVGLLWLLRDFFGLIFITFVLAFIAIPLIRLSQNKLKLPYRLSLTLVYIFFLVGLGSFFHYVTPSVIGEASRFMNNLSEVQSRLLELKQDIGSKYPGVERSLHGYIRSILDEETQKVIDRELNLFKQTINLPEVDQSEDEKDEKNSSITEATQEKLKKYYDKEAELLIDSLMTKQMNKVREQLPKLINHLYQATGTMLLALLFSFLILFDSVRLGDLMKSLHDSRLRDFYQETAQPVVRFAYVVGRAIQAQAMIACVNTFLTLIGLIFLGIPSVALLSLIVFVCSFIPVLGVFISTTPMVLIALNTGGLTLAIAIVVMITVIHIIEAYGLNPLIYGKHFKLNPVLVLIILLVAYHSFGLWGMILGVPVTYYFIHDVFGVPLWDERRLEPLNTALEASASE
ncbi:AI-2E family transporter [Nitrosomonas sp. Is37]|uniref:AI-2E family transporter n=1 Tax=Nitrosomonas sp. Is37 TaxID=3080535 RepID=UPI00294B5372|nr:AI-2E family transporter [Nitrosomonas sp. Is37]MDV6345841.1 AI-2E family transporter [Nitrosomonas sp. Is37]